MSSKLHAILSSRAILNNEDRAIIEPQIKALMLETYKEARNRYNSQYGVGPKYNQIHFFEEVLGEL